MRDLYTKLQRQPCPMCGTQGELEIVPFQYRVQCRACRNTLIDPFEIGPWSNKEHVIDTHGNIVVSSYFVEKKEPEPHEFDENWADFHKYMRERTT